jgi:hypothetical protein
MVCPGQAAQYGIVPSHHPLMATPPMIARWRRQMVRTPEHGNSDTRHTRHCRDRWLKRRLRRALRTVVRNLEPNLPAAVFVVLHMGARSHLQSILVRSGSLAVASAVSGGALEHGKIHVAVPGFHLLLHDGHMLLRRGPRENLARPAIDPLFRSAASFGSCVIGVVLGREGSKPRWSAKTH